ncbi:helix-turn-helix domain-containing protein [soil metagenome]
MPVQLAGRLANPDRAALGDACPLDRAMQVVGTRSAVLLMREALYGTRRFDDFATRVGITDAVAATRLKELVAVGLLERQPYQEPGQRTRYEYVLTDSGRDLLPALVALASWATEHVPHKTGPTATHDECGSPVRAVLRCDAGHVVGVEELIVSG